MRGEQRAVGDGCRTSLRCRPDGGGTVSNAAAGTIRSANWGIVATAQLATVADQGAVVGTFGSGVYLLAGGYVSNSASSVITAGYFGVQITGAAATVTWRGRRADCLWDVCGGGAVCEQRADAAGGWECGAGDGWVRLDGGGGGYLALNSTTGGVPSVACFAAGTPLQTPAREMAVEALQEGDLIRTVLGEGTSPVVWVGHRTIDCNRHPKPEAVWPVRIRAHALGRMCHGGICGGRRIMRSTSTRY